MNIPYFIMEKVYVRKFYFKRGVGQMLTKAVMMTMMMPNTTRVVCGQSGSSKGQMWVRLRLAVPLY